MIFNDISLITDIFTAVTDILSSLQLSQNYPVLTDFDKAC